MKVLVIISIIMCSFVSNIKLKAKNYDLSDFENGIISPTRFAESIFSDKGNENKII